jgi:DNA-binding HxlR family transcriptional regulator
MAKSYHQYCPIAHALDLVGDRWSLLVARELQHGPLRYGDLLERLGGCSTNMLAARLKDLETGGVVHKRRLPPPAAATVYELSDSGVALRPVLASLARWGARTLGPPDENADLTPGWLERALRTAVAPTAPDARVAFQCGDETASLLEGSVLPGLRAEAAATVTCDAAGFYHLLVHGELDGVSVAGDTHAVERLVAATAPTP